MREIVTNHINRDPTTYVGAKGVVIINETTGAMALHDGVTVGGNLLGSEKAPTTGLVATGTNQGTALALTSKGINVIATAAAGTGVILPATPVVNDTYWILNLGANAVLVYPGTGDAINALSVNAGFSVPAGSTALFKAVSTALWLANKSA